MISLDSATRITPKPHHPSLSLPLCLLLMSLGALACDDDAEADDALGEVMSFVDPCAIEPGPNCCALADNGLCEEPYGCFLGTDSDDCRGPVELEALCDESTPTVGEADEVINEEVEFTWTDQAEELSFTEAPLLFKLPSDISGVSVSVADDERETGFHWSLNGQPLLGASGSMVATVALPYDGESAPEAGCLAVWPLVEAERRGESAELFVVTRRFEPEERALDVHVITVGETDVTQEDLEASFAVATRIYRASGGPQLNIISYLTVEGDSLINAEGPEINALRAQELTDSPSSLPVYIIDGFLDDEGTLGIAGGLPGPNGAPSTPVSGLVVAVEPHLAEGYGGWSLDTALMGSTIAHELGHQLGLGHTTEDDGTTSSPIRDLDSCARAEIGSAEPAECPDGRNLMFWTSGDEPQEELTPNQVYVLNHNPIIY